MDEEAVDKLTDEAQLLAVEIITAMVMDESDISEALSLEIAEFIGLEMPTDSGQIFRSWLLASALASYTRSALKLASHAGGMAVPNLLEILALSRQKGPNKSE